MTTVIPLGALLQPRSIQFGRPGGFHQEGIGNTQLHFLDTYTGWIGVNFQQGSLGHEDFRSFIPLDENFKMQAYGDYYREGIASMSLASFAGSAPKVAGVDFAAVRFQKGDTGDYELLTLDFQLGVRDAVIHSVAYSVFVLRFYQEREGDTEYITLGGDRTPDDPPR